MSSDDFNNKDEVPNDAKLKQVLGAIYSGFIELEKVTAKYKHEWKYYGKNYGWQMKVADAKKALFYLTPAEKSFKIGFAVRENEKEILLNSDISSKIKEELRVAKKYPEGYALRLEITRPDEISMVKMIVDILMDSRS